MLSPVFRGLVYHMIMQRHGYCMWVASNRKIVVIICVKSTQTLWLVKLAIYKLWVSKPQITSTLLSKGHLTATYHNIIICLYCGPIVELVIWMKCPPISWNGGIPVGGKSSHLLSSFAWISKCVVTAISRAWYNWNRKAKMSRYLNFVC